MRARVIETGHCIQNEALSHHGAKPKRISFPATVGIIEHPQEGLVLFDTGYSPWFFKATQRYPERLYRHVTPVTSALEMSAASQVRAMGHRPEDVKTIVVSHFHADHIGGVRDFPNAHFVCSGKGYETLMAKSRIPRLFNGFLKDLLPNDFERRAKWIEDIPDVGTLGFGSFGLGKDLFGDGHCMIVDLPGHAHGHIGMVARTRRSELFFVGDACWSLKAAHTNTLPHPLSHVVIRGFDKANYRATLKKLSGVVNSDSHVKVIPCHCSSTKAFTEAEGEAAWH